MQATVPTITSPIVRADGAPHEAGRLLYRFEAQLSPTPIGLIPEGLLMANAFEGTVTEGLLRGGRVWGVDHLLIRSDGISVIDAPKTITLGDVSLFEHVRGYCVPPADLQLPSLDRLVEPEFAWPDVPFRVVATSTFKVAHPQLAHLRAAIAVIEGRVSFATGRLQVETRLVG
jgi:hypothetical protein